MTVEKLVNSYCFDFIKAVDELILAFPGDNKIVKLENIDKIPYDYQNIPVTEFEFFIQSLEEKGRKRYMFFIETR